MKKIVNAIILAVVIVSQTFPHPVFAQGLELPVTVDDPPSILWSYTGDGGTVGSDYTIEGNGTPFVKVTINMTQFCRNEIDPDNLTSFCTVQQAGISGVNDTGAAAKLNICGRVYFDPLAPGTGTYTATMANDVNIVSHTYQGYYRDLPYQNCMVYDLSPGESYAAYMVQTHPFVYDAIEGENYTVRFEFFLSWSISDNCETDYTMQTIGTWEIDPTIEFPVGAPDDDQVYSVQTGAMYAVTLEGGPWNYGAGNTWDAAISWDGTTWDYIGWSADLVCMSADGDRVTYWFFAQSDTFHIRAHDDPGQFGDNTPVIAFMYTLSLGIEQMAPCESQYSFDETQDLIGFTGVNATNSAGVLLNNMDIKLTAGEWYMVRWNTGFWKDDGIGPDRIDLEYSTDQQTWGDLLVGAAGVWCATSDGKQTLFQATGEDIYIRVNNVTSTFLTNTGNPFYDLYRVTFIRTPTSCETKYKVENLIAHDVVDADTSSGYTFMTINTRPDSSVWGLPQGVEYGGWYVLDTTDGPWREFSLGSTPWRYDMAISTDDGSTWTPLEDWTGAACNFEIDAVGHRRIVFQAPFNGSVRWKLRVNDTGLFAGNQGSMEWDLYGASSLASEPANGQCDYSYDVGSPFTLGEVQGNDENGVSIAGLTAGQMYVVKIVGQGYGWKESVLDPTRYDAEFSDDNGSTWSDVPNDYTGALCSSSDGTDTFVFINAAQNRTYALRVNSTTFSNNTGSLGYAVYPAQAGQSVVNTCFDGWSLQEINPFEWLDVKAEAGEIMTADTARYQEFVALVPGRVYAVETPAGQGPWGSFDALGTERYDVALSKDNGATWEEVNADSTIVDCTARELIGGVWKAKFTVAEGDVWKIRVNDTNGAFADNTGNMAYKLYVLCEGMACTGSVPNDSTNSTNGIPAVSIQGGGDVCQLAVLRPGPLSAAELFSLGNYLASWVQYMNLSILRYMAWCPTHTSLIVTFLDGFKTREPLATIDELNQLLQYTKNKLDSYDWGGFENTSLFSVRSVADVRRMIDENIIKRDTATVNPWDGKKIIQFGDTSLPASYYSCNSAFASGLPTRLKSAVCFVSAYFKQTGAAFWVQLLIVDIPAVGIIFAGVKTAIEGLISLMIGYDITKRDKETEKWLREQTRLMEEQNALLGRRRK